VTAQCHNCGNWSAHCISSWEWFTFCWIPVIPLGGKHKDVRFSLSLGLSFTRKRMSALESLWFRKNRRGTCCILVDEVLTRGFTQLACSICRFRQDVKLRNDVMNGQGGQGPPPGHHQQGPPQGWNQQGPPQQQQQGWGPPPGQGQPQYK
jgi:hypothetical protein